LLHRPDTLVEPEEVAEAFNELHNSGKVRNFGVSNFNPGQIELLQASLPMKLHANQLQLSITNTGMIDRGITVNMKHVNSIDHDGGFSITAGSKRSRSRLGRLPVRLFEGVFVDNPKFPELNKVLGDLSESYGVTKTDWQLLGFSAILPASSPSWDNQRRSR